MNDKRKQYELGDTAVMEILLTDSYGREGQITLKFDTSAWGGIAEALKKEGVEYVAKFVAEQVQQGIESQLSKVLEEEDA